MPWIVSCECRRWVGAAPSREDAEEMAERHWATHAEEAESRPVVRVVEETDFILHGFRQLNRG
jgi:hypothetical protein